MSTTEPEVISMDSSSRDGSYYRIRCGSRVKYLTVTQGTLHGDELLMPLYALPPLPYTADDWTKATITRREDNNELSASLSDAPLPSVKEVWHPESVDCLLLRRVAQLSVTTFECTREDRPGTTAIAKVARFEWEVPRIECESRVYRLLDGTGAAPRFLAHVAEQGRTIGLLVEKVEGRAAGIEDLEGCRAVLSQVHERGLLHGDVNRYNFIVGEAGVTLIDFETSCESRDAALLGAEMASLEEQLAETTGRGGGFVEESSDEEGTQ